jgi:hypothetical protein
MVLLMQMASNTKYSKGMMSGPYNPRPRLIDPKLVPAARKGLSAPWAVFSLYICLPSFISFYLSVPTPGSARSHRHSLARACTHMYIRSCICSVEIVWLPMPTTFSRGFASHIGGVDHEHTQ